MLQSKFFYLDIFDLSKKNHAVDRAPQGHGKFLAWQIFRSFNLEIKKTNLK